MPKEKPVEDKPVVTEDNPPDPKKAVDGAETVKPSAALDLVKDAPVPVVKEATDGKGSESGEGDGEKWIAVVLGIVLILASAIGAILYWRHRKAEKPSA